MKSLGARNCVSCGRTIPWDADICLYCGKDYRPQTLPPQQQQVSSGMRILLYIISFLVPIAGFVIGAIYYLKPEQEYKHVGKMCIVMGIAAVIFTIGLGMLLYVWFLGTVGSEGEITPAITVLRRQSITDGFRIEFTAPTSEVKWSDVTIQLTDGSNTVSWDNATTEALTGTAPEIWHYGSAKTLGSLSVFLNITDLAANGRMSNGDYITLTLPSAQSFASSTTYTVTLLYEPTDGAMVSYEFTG